MTKHLAPAIARVAVLFEQCCLLLDLISFGALGVQAPVESIMEFVFQHGVLAYDSMF
jgi:hypothetical protein